MHVGRQAARFGPRAAAPLPRCFDLRVPAEAAALGVAMGGAPASELWIVKPVGGARGQGVRLVGGEPAELTASERSGCLVQRYVARPLLLGGLKVRPGRSRMIRRG